MTQRGTAQRAMTGRTHNRARAPQTQHRSMTTAHPGAASSRQARHVDTQAA
jgi:hypothetical protein